MKPKNDGPKALAKLMNLNPRHKVRTKRPKWEGEKLSVNISFWLEPEMARQLQEFCFARRLNKSAICRDAVIEYLEKLKSMTYLVVEKP